MPNTNTQILSMGIKYFEPNIPFAADVDTKKFHVISAVILHLGLQGCLHIGAVLISLY